jgi:hypothetical protein
MQIAPKMGTFEWQKKCRLQVQDIGLQASEVGLDSVVGEARLQGAAEVATLASDLSC